MPKFQAIQAANEVLGDPASKQKYDTDRRKAGLYPVGPTFNPRQPAPGNPYAANSAYPPPPRRTQPTAWQRAPPPQTPGAAPPNGADRFSNFPRPSPTARKDAAQDRTNAFKAWENMTGPQSRQRNFNQGPAPQPPPPPPPQPQANRQRPQPPPRQETKFPTDEQIRGGMKYKNVPPLNAEGLDQRQSAWQAFSQTNPGRASMPNVGRKPPPTNTPRRQGFNPNMPGSDEKPAESHYRNQSADMGRGKPFVKVPPPPPSGGTSSGTAPNTPSSPISPRSQHPYPDPTRPHSSRTPNDQVPYAEGQRNRTPYASFLRERTDLGDGLRRSYSTHNTTKLGPEDAASKSRARSTSPLGRQRASESFAQESAKKNAFDIGYSSSEASETDPNVAQTSDDVNGSSQRPSRPGTAPNTAPPFERPKKVPTPPSSRFNGTRNGPTSPPPMPGMPHMNGTADGAQSDGEQRSMQQKSKSNMYADPSSSSSFYSSQPSTAWMFGSSSTSRARRTWSNVGQWAIPSSVNPALRTQQNDHDSFVTASDELFKRATQDEKNAYFRLQSELEKHFDWIPDNFDMEVFLKLASTARQEVSCGDETVDRLLRRVLLNSPMVGYTQDDLANDANSFTFPQDDNLFESTNAKSRSAENINTSFSPDGWTGAFTGERDYFAPPPSTGRKVSPTQRTNTGSNRSSKEQPSSATTDIPRPTSAPREEFPHRPWGSDGRPKDVPLSTAPGEVKFSKEEWEKTFQDASWTWPPPPPKSGSPTKSSTPGQARKQSQGRRASKPGNRNVTGSEQQPHPAVVDEDDTVEVEGADGRPESGAPVMNDDPMDIDDTPPSQKTTAAQDGSSTQSTEKEPRLYSVPKSVWRQEQEQKQNQTQRHRKTSSAARRAARASVSDGAKLNTTLDDLRNVEPFAKSADAAGLHNLGDIGATLPFQSQAAPQILVPQRLDMPGVPKPPPEPTKLTNANWHIFSHSFGEYLKAFHVFNNTMLQHFNAREKVAEARFMGGTGWLEATGDTTGIQGAPSGFGSYLTGVLEDEKVRESWNVGCEKHIEACKAFDKVRGRVKRLTAAGGLADDLVF